MPNAVDPRHHDVRQERVGGFAGPVMPSAPFGKYAGPPRRRWQAAGGFSGRPTDSARVRTATSSVTVAAEGRTSDPALAASLRTP